MLSLTHSWVGTTGIAATTEGFNFIGIEREEEYIEIARHRIAHWVEEKKKKSLEKREGKLHYFEAIT